MLKLSKSNLIKLFPLKKWENSQRDTGTSVVLRNNDLNIQTTVNNTKIMRFEP